MMTGGGSADFLIKITSMQHVLHLVPGEHTISYNNNAVPTTNTRPLEG